MKYKIGDMIVCNTEKPPEGMKRLLLNREPSSDSVLGSGSFQIVAKDEFMETYKIIIDDDMVGWQIGEFHIEHEKVPAAFKGKKFYDIHESFVLRKDK